MDIKLADVPIPVCSSNKILVRNTASLISIGIERSISCYADAIVTIYYRWKRGENLMQAHRSHLYQYMSNELGMPHWQVSLMYAIIQLCFGVFAILAYQKGLTLQIVVLVAFSGIFVISYNRIKKIEPKMALE